MTYVHVILGAGYLVFGLLQFSSALRRRYLAYHRWAGRLLVTIGIVMALAGMYFGLVMPFRGAGRDVCHRSGRCSVPVCDHPRFRRHPAARPRDSSRLDDTGVRDRAGDHDCTDRGGGARPDHDADGILGRDDIRRLALGRLGVDASGHRVVSGAYGSRSACTAGSALFGDIVKGTADLLAINPDSCSLPLIR